jgi:hypothetical protein
MRIIQSFAKFEEGNPYDKNKNTYLNFYSFLLSYLTLNRYYGHVTMFCNQTAYDSFIKYIPYDEIIILENNNSFVFWSYYKIDAMKTMTEKFIHVDSDVFIFDDIFRVFITGDYDIIVQNRWVREQNDYIRDFVDKNLEFVIDNNIIDPNVYDGGSLCSGVVGMKLEIRDQYVDYTTKIKKAYGDDKLTHVEGNAISLISEELPLHLLALKKNYSVYEVLPKDLVMRYGALKAGMISKYTHMWFASKFDAENIKLMRNKIIKDFPKYKSLIEDYESRIFQKIRT